MAIRSKFRMVRRLLVAAALCSGCGVATFRPVVVPAESGDFHFEDINVDSKFDHLRFSATVRNDTGKDWDVAEFEVEVAGVSGRHVSKETIEIRNFRPEDSRPIDLVMPQVFETVAPPKVHFTRGVEESAVAVAAAEQAGNGADPATSKISPGADPNLPRFRGVTLGAPLKPQFPQCRSLGWGDSSEETYPCVSYGSSIRFQDSLNRLLGNTLVVRTYDDSKIGMLSTSFPSGNAEGILELLTAKYGAAKSVEEKPWQSKGGVQTTSVEALWELGPMVIQAKSPAHKVDEGSLMIIHHPFLVHREKKQNEVFLEQVGDL